MKKAKEGKFYITTAIDYVNAEPHIGHAYQKIIADILARWHGLLGEDVFFLTGTDEHGQKVSRSAKEAGLKEKEFVDKISRKFKEAWDKLNIKYSRFIRTTDKDHEKVVLDFIEKIKKDIYEGIYEGLYCVDCEAYKTEKDLANGECPFHPGKKLEELKEETYFFKLSKYKDKLLELYERNHDYILPRKRAKEIINRVKEGLDDLSITRSKVKWGIPYPYDKNHVVYVWFDALLNYLTGINWPKEGFERYWPADIQLLGVDNSWFHCVIWPAMLMSAGINSAKSIFVHGFLTFNGQKISKSLGNVISPKILIEKYGADSIRYFVCRNFVLGQDGDFSEEALKQRYNTELADKLGNLVSRIEGLAEKFLKGKIPQGRIDDQLVDQLQLDDIKKRMLHLELDKALALIFAFVDSCNLYIQEKRPWDIPWEIPPEPASMERISNILYTLIDSLRVTAILLSPFMPNTAKKIAEQLGVKLGTLHECKFGLTKATKIKKGPVLFEKIKVKD